jgi:hypothetical protein
MTERSLAELEPAFVQITVDGFSDVVDLAEADGVRFLCPGCYRKRGAEGTHQILCWSPRVADCHSPGPGRWIMRGEGLDSLTLSPSVVVDCWHGVVRDGKVYDS